MYWTDKISRFTPGSWEEYERYGTNNQDYMPSAVYRYQLENKELHKRLEQMEHERKLLTEYKEKKEKEKMNTSSIFNGMFGRVAPGMCRISMSGKVAIKTSSGYKAYDVVSGKLTNCDNFAFDIGEDMFFIMPTNKVEKGDIIIASGRPKCVIEATKNEIKVFSYEDGTIETIVPERHIFMGKQYFYGKIVSMFGSMMSKKNGGMNNIFKYMMMSEMMKGNTNNMMPMMFMMNGGGSGSMFDGMFDFDDDDEETEEEKDDE